MSLTNQDTNDSRIASGYQRDGFFLPYDVVTADQAEQIRLDLEAAEAELGATIVGLDDIYDLDVDIYAPCALGATVNDNTIDRIKASIIAGCANNQLAEARHDQLLRDKGILYAPDYVINAGGIINVSFEKDYDKTKATAKVEEIYATLLDIFARADTQQKPTGIIADQMAREIIARGGK